MILEKQHYLCALCALENPNLVCISSDTENYGLRREIFRKKKGARPETSKLRETSRWLG